MTRFTAALADFAALSTDGPTRRVAARRLVAIDSERMIAGLPSIFA